MISAPVIKGPEHVAGASSKPESKWPKSWPLHQRGKFKGQPKRASRGHPFLGNYHYETDEELAQRYGPKDEEEDEER